MNAFEVKNPDLTLSPHTGMSKNRSISEAGLDAVYIDLISKIRCLYIVKHSICDPLLMPA